MPDKTPQKYAIQAGQPIVATVFYVKTVSIQASANDFTIVVHDTLPVVSEEGGGVSPDDELERPIGIIKLSPQSAKDFAIALVTAVRQYEDHYHTELVTDGTLGAGL